jgi:hypothetical protein
MPMRCRTCRARLEYADNFCRKCGAAAEIIEVEVIGSTPGRQVAPLRAALPVVARGATVLLTGALLRLALRQFLVRDSPIASLSPFGRRSRDAGVVEELIYYRRSHSR